MSPTMSLTTNTKSCFARLGIIQLDAGLEPFAALVHCGNVNGHARMPLVARERLQGILVQWHRCLRIEGQVVLDDSRRVGIGLDRTERQRAEQQREILIAELYHRVKNTLALVQALARQSFRHHPETVPARRAYEGRSKSPAAAHDLLTVASWHASCVTSLVEMVIAVAAPYPGAVKIEGTVLPLAPKPVVTMAMILHELATNALKHGASSVDGGRVSLSWERDAG